MVNWLFREAGDDCQITLEVSHVFITNETRFCIEGIHCLSLFNNFALLQFVRLFVYVFYTK